MASAHVLFVDDNEHQLKLLEVYSRTLRDTKVDYVDCLDSAIDMLRSALPDLIFLDNRLHPFSDFRETVPKLRDAGYSGKIVVYSADVEQPAFKEADAMGITACLDKKDMTLSNYKNLISDLL